MPALLYAIVKKWQVIMTLSENLLFALVAFPIVVLIIYSAIVIIGNQNILRAGGQTSHENYPKVIEHLKTVFISVTIGFLLFFLIVLGFFPSDSVVALVSAAVGAFGAELYRRQK